jgi:hypothetical protein
MSSPVKNFVKSIPVLGPFLVHLRGNLQHRDNEVVTNSSQYWEQRYKEGGNSGAGSYNNLAKFKAAFLNNFVEMNNITSVIEHGSGDGAQLKLAAYPSYTGLDISTTAVERCRTLFAGDSSKRFLHASELNADLKADLALSLDVIYHLLEDSVFDGYMRKLFESATKFVIIYSSNIDATWSASHVRHRQFTRWVEENKPDWHLLSTVKNAFPYDEKDPNRTSFADFYVFGIVRPGDSVNGKYGPKN